MHAWVPFALVRITFFYVIGTLICIYKLVIFSHSSIFFITLGVAICYALLWVLIRRNSLRRFNIVLSLTGFLTILCLGYLNVKWSNQSEKENHIINSKKIEIYAGRVVEPMHETNKTFRYLISVNALKDSIWKSASGLVYFYVNKDSEKVLKPGDQLLINGAPSELTPPLNPGEFDYKRFLSFKNIYHQDYSNGDSFVVVGHKNINWFLHTANTIRDWAKRKIKYAIPHAREQKIALALILGVRDGLTDDIKSAYSASGAMHVLAVSGLHVGIIYGIVLILFGKLQHGAAGRRGFALLTISLLWFYAAITGFSPSVLRAATMFSFIALAKGFGRNTNIYNTLAGSGLILLVFDPYLIMSVGFQLSYLAVVGIIYFQPKIYNLFISKNWILDKIWMITTVSVAAQLATFSLGLLYFHQFPTFFLLSNLVVIPGALFILTSGLLLLAVSFVPWLYIFMGWVLSKVIYWINEGVFFIQSLPFSLLEGIYINTLQTWLLMIAIVALFLARDFKRVTFIYVSIFATVCFIGLRLEWLLQEVDKEEMTIHRVSNHTAISLIDRGKSLLITDSVLWLNTDRKRFHLAPNQLISGVDESLFMPLKVEQPLNVFSWKGLEILVVSGNLQSWNWEGSTNYDYVILSQNYSGSLDDVLKLVNCKNIVLDGSLKGYVADRLLRESVDTNKTIHSVYHYGAKTIHL